MLLWELSLCHLEVYYILWLSFSYCPLKLKLSQIIQQLQDTKIVHFFELVIMKLPKENSP